MRIIDVLVVASVVFFTGCGSESGSDRSGGNSNAEESVIAQVREQYRKEIAKLNAAAMDKRVAREMATIERHLANPDQPGKAFYEMVKEIGGFTAFSKLARRKDKTAVKALLKKYGLGFSEELSGAIGGSTRQTHLKQSIFSCDQYFTDRFPPAVNGMVHEVGVAKHLVYIAADTEEWGGQPTWAEIVKDENSGPVLAGTRDEPCQGKVNQWGYDMWDHHYPDRAEPDWDGGHLIPTTLGGFGLRANLVPQIRKLNRRQWKVAENAAKRCFTDPRFTDAVYRVDVTYGGPYPVGGPYGAVPYQILVGLGATGPEVIPVDKGAFIENTPEGSQADLAAFKGACNDVNDPFDPLGDVISDPELLAALVLRLAYWAIFRSPKLTP